MAIDGNVNLGTVNGGPTSTPFSVDGVLEPGSLINGDGLLSFYQQGGTFNDIIYVGGSLEGPVPLPLFDVAANGFAGGVHAGSPLDMVLPAFSVAAGDGGITLPPFVVSAQADNQPLVTGNAVLPQYTATGALEMALELPSFSVAATGFAGALTNGDATLPLFSVSATTGTRADATLLPFDVSASGLTGAIASGDVRVLPFAVGADAMQDNTADGSVTLALFSVDATGDGIAVIDGSVTLMPFEIVAAGINGVAATADLTLPLFVVDASGYMDNVGTATIVLPAFVVGGEALAGDAGVPIIVGDKPVPQAGVPNTVVLNTRLKAVTLYDGLHANSFATFQGVTLAATPQGIVALAGDDDLGAAIEARVVSGLSDLGMQSIKQVLTAYVGYRAEDEMDLTLITDEHHEYSYTLAPMQSGDDLHASRVKFGRGVSGRYWQWRLENRRGANFDLGHIEFHVQPHKRGV